MNIGLNIGFIMVDKPFSFHPDFRDDYCRLQKRWLNFDRFLRTSTAQLVSLITHERELEPSENRVVAERARSSAIE